MRKTLLIFWLFFIFLGISMHQAIAQKNVFLCESYTNSGQPIKPDVEWAMKSTGGGVYILFTNGGDLIPWTTMYLFIDKYTDGKYKEYDNKTITPDKSKAWYVHDYRFKEEGSYRVSFCDNNGEKLASEYIEIIIKSNQPETNSNSKTEFIFCASLDENENPQETGTTFYIDRITGNYIYIYIKNQDLPFNTDGLILDFWKGNDYADKIDTKELTIQPQWVATYIKYTFMVAGEYKIMLYSKDQTHLSTGYVTIKYK